MKIRNCMALICAVVALSACGRGKENSKGKDRSFGAFT